jgi:DNA polymerase-3 subunit alpha
MDKLSHIPYLNVQTNCNLSFSLINIEDLINLAIEKKIKVVSIADYQPYDFLRFYHLCRVNKIKPIWGLKKVLKINEFDSLLITFFPKKHSDYKYLNKILYKNNDLIEVDTLRDLSDKCLLVLESSNEEDFILLSNLKKKLDSHLENADSSNVYIGINFFPKDIESLRSKFNSSNILPFFSIKSLEKDDEGFLNVLKKTTLTSGFLKEDVSSNWISYLSLEDFFNLLKVKSSKKSDYFFQEEFYNKLFSQLSIFFSKIDLVIKNFKSSEKDEDFLNLKGKCEEELISLLFDKEEDEKNKYLNTLEKELIIIKNFGFSKYFLTLKQIINNLNEFNLEIGPGRGSAVSSLVSYLLKITRIDPIKHDLFFWRFLNEKREDYPDVDVDIDNQEEALQIIQKQYGKNHVAKIVTRKKIGWVNAVKASLKIFNVNEQDADFIEENATDFNQNNHLSWKVRQILEKYKEMFEFIEKINNLNYSSSIHASGLIISDKSLSLNIPVKEEKDFLISLYQKDYLGSLGFIKYDFLSLTESLGFIKNIRKNFTIPDYEDLDLNDEKTWNIFKKCLLVGVFQVDTRFFREIFSKLKPNNFQDLILVLALNRPGANKNVEDILRKREMEDYSKKKTFSLDLLNEILSSTYGNIIFEEQVSQILSCFLNIDFSTAELLRKKLKKIINNKEELDKFKIHFFNDSIETMPYSEKNLLWVRILQSVPYMFNKAHTTAYAYLTYYTAYLKANFFNDSMIFLLNKYSNNLEKMSVLFQEVTSLGYQIVTPEVNSSSLDWKIGCDSKTFVMGFSQLRSNNAFFECLVRERDVNGEFKNWKDLIERNIKYFEKFREEDLINLVKLDVFKSLNISSEQLIENLNFIRRYIEIKKLIKSSNSENLPFLKINDSKDLYGENQEFLFNLNEREFENFNFHFTYLKRWKKINEDKVNNIEFFWDWFNNQNLSYEERKINIYSVVLDFRKVKKGYLLKLQDFSSFVEFFISDFLYEKNTDKIIKHKELLLTISGKLKSHDYQYFKIESIKD